MVDHNSVDDNILYGDDEPVDYCTTKKRDGSSCKGKGNDSWNFGDYQNFDVPQFFDDKVAANVEKEKLDDDEIRSIFTACDDNERKSNATKRKKERESTAKKGSNIDNDNNNKNNSLHDFFVGTSSNKKNGNHDRSKNTSKDFRKTFQVILDAGDNNGTSSHGRASRESSSSNNNNNNKSTAKNNKKTKKKMIAKHEEDLFSLCKADSGRIHPCLISYSRRIDSNEYTTTPSSQDVHSGYDSEYSTTLNDSQTSQKQDQQQKQQESLRRTRSRNKNSTSRKSKSKSRRPARSRSKRSTSKSSKSSSRTRRSRSKDMTTTATTNASATATSTSKDSCSTNERITITTHFPKVTALRSTSVHGAYNEKWTSTTATSMVPSIPRSARCTKKLDSSSLFFTNVINAVWNRFQLSSPSR